MNRYKIVGVLGDGSYGSVVKGVRIDTGLPVAIKQLKNSPETWETCLALPEVIALRQLLHPNIVRLLEVCREKDSTLNLVFECCAGNLFEFVTAWAKRGGRIPEPLVADVARQMLAGLAFMHSRGLFHRDVKPENFLLDVVDSAPDGTPSAVAVKLADFGLAKASAARPPFTEYVSTRWYRAPEVLLQAQTYGPPVDVWAVGCVIAEALCFKPLFPGANEVDQLTRIIDILGSPAGVNTLGGPWPEGAALADRLGFSFPSPTQAPGMPSLSSVLRGVSPEAISFVEACLAWDPAARPSAQALMGHPWLAQLRTQRVPIQPSLHLPSAAAQEVEEEEASVAAAGLQREEVAAASGAGDMFPDSLVDDETAAAEGADASPRPLGVMVDEEDEAEGVEEVSGGAHSIHSFVRIPADVSAEEGALNNNTHVTTTSTSGGRDVTEASFDPAGWEGGVFGCDAAAAAVAAGGLDVTDVWAGDAPPSDLSATARLILHRFPMSPDDVDASGSGGSGGQGDTTAESSDLAESSRGGGLSWSLWFDHAPASLSPRLGGDGGDVSGASGGWGGDATAGEATLLHSHAFEGDNSSSFVGNTTGYGFPNDSTILAALGGGGGGGGGVPASASNSFAYAPPEPSPPTHLLEPEHSAVNSSSASSVSPAMSWPRLFGGRGAGDTTLRGWGGQDQATPAPSMPHHHPQFSAGSASSSSFASETAASFFPVNVPLAGATSTARFDDGDDGHSLLHGGGSSSSFFFSGEAAAEAPASSTAAAYWSSPRPKRRPGLGESGDWGATSPARPLSLLHATMVARSHTSGSGASGMETSPAVEQPSPLHAPPSRLPSGGFTSLSSGVATFPPGSSGGGGAGGIAVAKSRIPVHVSRQGLGSGGATGLGSRGSSGGGGLQSGAGAVPVPSQLVPPRPVARPYAPLVIGAVGRAGGATAVGRAGAGFRGQPAPGRAPSAGKAGQQHPAGAPRHSAAGADPVIAAWRPIPADTGGPGPAAARATGLPPRPLQQLVRPAAPPAAGAGGWGGGGVSVDAGRGRSSLAPGGLLPSGIPVHRSRSSSRGRTGPV